MVPFAFIVANRVLVTDIQTPGKPGSNKNGIRMSQGRVPTTVVVYVGARKSLAPTLQMDGAICSCVGASACIHLHL